MGSFRAALGPGFILSKKNEIYHQIANDLGIAIGMVQLARKKAGLPGGETPQGVVHYLERADEALGRLKIVMQSLRDLDPDLSQSPQS